MWQNYHILGHIENEDVDVFCCIPLTFVVISVNWVHLLIYGHGKNIRIMAKCSTTLHTGNTINIQDQTLHNGLTETFGSFTEHINSLQLCNLNSYLKYDYQLQWTLFIINLNIINANICGNKSEIISTIMS